jgi:hypothetical protein
MTDIERLSEAVMLNAQTIKALNDRVMHLTQELDRVSALADDNLYAYKRNEKIIKDLQSENKKMKALLKALKPLPSRESHDER